MKQIIMIDFIIALVALLMSCACNEASTKSFSDYKYIITYPTASGSTNDYTDSYEYVPKTSGIRYTDENGYIVERHGSFTIRQRK